MAEPRTYKEIVASVRLDLAKRGSLMDICGGCGCEVRLVGREDDSRRKRESVLLGESRIYEGELGNLPQSCFKCGDDCLARGLLEKKGEERL